MNRRELLAASSAGVLFGGSGCLDGPTAQNEERADKLDVRDDVEECTETEDWGDEATSGPADPASGSIADRFDCAYATRPEPTGDVCKRFVVDGEYTYESVGVEPYPDPPSELTDSTITTFVHEYEQARFTNGQVASSEEQFVGGGLSVEEENTRILDMYPDITVVRVQYSMTISRFEYDTNDLSEGSARGAAVYGVDETGVVHTSTDYVTSDELEERSPDEVPDPVEDGDLLECF